MNQQELDKQLARSTGESLATIRRRGFSLLEIPNPPPQTIDWDEVYPIEVRRKIPRRSRRAA
jgi:hypothetical protein